MKKASDGPGGLDIKAVGSSRVQLGHKAQFEDEQGMFDEEGTQLGESLCLSLLSDIISQNREKKRMNDYINEKTMGNDVSSASATFYAISHTEAYAHAFFLFLRREIASKR